MSANQTLVPQNEEEVSEPMKETSAVHSDATPTSEDLNSIEANSEGVNPEKKLVVVEEEERGGSLDGQSDKVETSDTPLEEKENSDAKLENSEGTDDKLERDAISGGQTDENESIEVQAEGVAEGIGEEDVASGNKVDGSEENAGKEVIANKTNEQLGNDTVLDDKRDENDAVSDYKVDGIGKTGEDEEEDRRVSAPIEPEGKENSDAKLENSEGTDEKLERDAIYGGQTDENKSTKVQAEGVAERIGEEAIASVNKVDESEEDAGEEVIANKTDEQLGNDAVVDDKRDGNDAVSDDKVDGIEKAGENEEEDGRVSAPVEPEGEILEEKDKSSPFDDGKEGGEFDPEIKQEKINREVSVAETKHDGQIEGGESPNVDQPIVSPEEMKAKVLVSPSDETVTLPVTGTSGPDTFVANGVKDGGVLDARNDTSGGETENLTRDDNVASRGHESEESDTKVETRSDGIAIRDVSGDPKEIEVAAENYDEVLTGDELEDDEMEGIGSQPARVAILENREAKEIMKEIEEASAGIDGQLASDSDEEIEEGIEFEDDDEDREEDREDDEERESFDSALAELLRAATGGDGNFVISSQDDSTGSGTGGRIFKIDRPAGLGPSAPALRPRPTGTTAARPSSQLAAIPSESGTVEEMSEEERALHEKIEGIRVKFLRLVYRSGHSPDDTVARQVLHRLSLAEGFRRGRMTGTGIGSNTSIDAAWKKALQLEANTGAGTDDLKFSVNILVLGKAGVGKSATINSIVNSDVTSTNPFAPATSTVKQFSSMVDGIKFNVIDTPGLKTSVMDQNANRKILTRVKGITKKCPPDIVLYVDRIDTQTRDLNDLPLLRTITSVLGSSIWFNAIVALTHAGLAPPDGPNGSPLTYDSFVAQRSHVVQLAVRQGAGDMRIMNPVALVENHQSCRRNRDGHKILPNGQSWRQELLLLCYSSKILSEANELLKLQDNSSGSAASKLFGFRFRSPPLPFLLSSLLQTRAHPKLANDQGGEINGDSDVELDDFSDYEEDDDDEYDQLPPFKPLRKSQIAKLSKEQRKAYFEEYEYRVKLLQKKQWREEVRRMKEVKRRKEKETGPAPGFEPGEDYDQDNAPASVQVPLPDMVLPPSFDGDAPTYRYRFLEPTSGFLARPVLDTHGWDHDCGYDGVSLEETLALAGMFPANVSAQITKDKKEFSIHLESAISAKHGDNGSSLAGFDIQTIGRQLGYILRGETKFKNLKRNKTTGGITVTFLGDIVAAGAKLEDQLTLGKRLTLVASTGGVRAQGDIAYGANLEARLRDKDYPIGQALTTLGLSLMKWRGDLALGANLQSQIPVGTGSKVALRVGLNNKLSGQITVRTSTSDHFQIAFLALVPVISSVIRTLRSGSGGESFAY